MDSDSDDGPIVPRRAASKRQAVPKLQPASKRVRVVAPAPSRAAQRYVSDDDDDDDDYDDESLASPPKAKRVAPKAKARAAQAKKGAARAPAKRTKKAVMPQSSDDDIAAEEDNSKRTFKEGQRSVCPPMGDPQRAFYESLIQEKPHSIIAIKWCIEHGVLMGSQLKQTLKHYKALKAAGAFRPGHMGGLKPDFDYLFAQS